MTDPSRREFLAMSALGVFALSRGAGTPVDEELLYVGTYTEGDHAGGIHLVRLDVRTGALRHESAVNAGANPSFLAIHPDGSTLYAVNEVTEREGEAAGGVSAFAIAETGALQALNEQSSCGGAPCYVSVDRGGRAVMVANYVGGNVALLPIRRGGMLGAATHEVQHMGSGPDRERQTSAHAHCIVADPSNRFALAADLGVDRVLVYRMDTDAGTLTHVERSDGVLPPGAGPRHVAFHPRLPLVYVANELNSTVATFRFDTGRGAMALVESRSTLPAGWTGTSYVADIHVAPDGHSLYVSNRGHNSIARFSVADRTGALRLEDTVPTGGDWPRNFSLAPGGRWLLVGNQRSGDIVVLARDPANGRLTPTSHRLAISRVACLRFRAHVGVTT